MTDDKQIPDQYDDDEDSETITRNISADADLWKSINSSAEKNAPPPELFSAELHVPNPTQTKNKLSIIREHLHRPSAWIAMGVICSGIFFFLGTLINSAPPPAPPKSQPDTAAHKATEQQLAACQEKESRCGTMLNDCVADFGSLTTAIDHQPRPQAIGASNPRLKSALNKKTALETELEELHLLIFNRLDMMPHPRNVKRHVWRAFRKELKKRKKLHLKLRQAINVYELSLAAAAGSGDVNLTVDPALRERHQQRSDALEQDPD